MRKTFGLAFAAAALASLAACGGNDSRISSDPGGGGSPQIAVQDPDLVAGMPQACLDGTVACS